MRLLTSLFIPNIYDFRSQNKVHRHQFLLNYCFILFLFLNYSSFTIFCTLYLPDYLHFLLIFM